MLFYPLVGLAPSILQALSYYSCTYYDGWTLNSVTSKGLEKGRLRTLDSVSSVTHGSEFGRKSLLDVCIIYLTLCRQTVESIVWTL